MNFIGVLFAPILDGDFESAYLVKFPKLKSLLVLSFA